jgi:hypothetical protein
VVPLPARLPIDGNKNDDRQVEAHVPPTIRFGSRIACRSNLTAPVAATRAPTKFHACSEHHKFQFVGSLRPGSNQVALRENHRQIGMTTRGCNRPVTVAGVSMCTSDANPAVLRALLAGTLAARTRNLRLSVRLYAIAGKIEIAR